MNGLEFLSRFASSLLLGGIFAAIVLACQFGPSVVFAKVEIYQFENPNDESLYRQLIQELRCLVLPKPEPRRLQCRAGDRSPPSHPGVNPARTVPPANRGLYGCTDTETLSYTAPPSIKPRYYSGFHRCYYWVLHWWSRSVAAIRRKENLSVYTEEEILKARSFLKDP